MNLTVITLTSEKKDGKLKIFEVPSKKLTLNNTLALLNIPSFKDMIRN